jgi:hypothetical protein
MKRLRDSQIESWSAQPEASGFTLSPRVESLTLLIDRGRGLAGTPEFTGAERRLGRPETAVDDEDAAVRQRLLFW